jgi:hypothetical protein
MNRAVKRDDNLLYSKSVDAMEQELKEGDIIFDFPNQPNKITYTQINKQWPQLIDRGTIWIDPLKLQEAGGLQDFKFNNDTLRLPWNIENVTIKILPTAQFNMTVGPQSYGGYLFKVNGVKNLTLDFENYKYKGLKEWPEDIYFVRDLFGAVFDADGSYSNRHLVYIDLVDGGKLIMKGAAIGGGGFSSFRFAAGKTEGSVSLDLSNFYFYGTRTGEGIYAGNTGSPPFTRLNNIHIHNGIIVHSPSEPVQLQHLNGNNLIENITIVNADTSWQNLHQPYQDSGFQVSIDSGTTTFRNIIMDGFASNGLVVYGSEGAQEGDSCNFENILFNDGNGILMYINKSCRYGMTWNFNNVIASNFNNEYYRHTGIPIADYLVSNNNGTDIFNFIDITHDGVKSKVFQDEKDFTVRNVKLVSDIKLPQYRNSGFLEKASQIKKWTPIYGGYFPNAVDTPTVWYKGDIAIYDEEGQHREYYKFKEDYTSDGITPPPFLAVCYKLTWDIKGQRNDWMSWDFESPQRLYAPHDYRCDYMGWGFLSPDEKLQIIDQYILNRKQVVFVTEKGEFRIDCKG